MKKLAFSLILTVFLIGFFAGGLKMADIFIQTQLPPASHEEINLPHRIHQMIAYDLYPFDGGHPQPNFDLVEDGRFRSGDHGFMVDFDIDTPPEKLPGEIRVIFIGGSTAWGFGAESNKQMYFHQFEEYFNAARPCGDGVYIRAINLAMPGSISYQNFISLNYWGHGLKPDMIISVSGFNELSADGQGSTSRSYTNYHGYRGLTYLLSNRYNADWHNTLGEYLPGIFMQSRVAMALRAMNFQTLQATATQEFSDRFPSYHDIVEYKQNVNIPFYLHAIESIRRDFPEIPMLLVQQPFMRARDADSKVERMHYMDVGHLEYIKTYESLLRDFRTQLTDSLGDSVSIFDLQSHYHEQMIANFDPYQRDPVHFDNGQQAAIGKLIGELATPEVCAIAAGSQVPSAPALTGHDGEMTLSYDGTDYVISPKSVNGGAVERFKLVDNGFWFRGWAVDESVTKSAHRVVVVANDRVVTEFSTGNDGISKGLAGYNPAYADAGFVLEIPYDGRLFGTVRFFVLREDGQATELKYPQNYLFVTGAQKGT